MHAALVVLIARLALLRRMADEYNVQRHLRLGDIKALADVFHRVLLRMRSAANGAEPHIGHAQKNILGTNDKDTNEPVFSQDEAKAHLEEILLKHFDGYTIMEANGGWADDGAIYSEYTL